MTTDLQQGRLEQVCPACGLREAAGHYCSACLRKTGAADWRKAVLTDAQRAARASRHSAPEVAATDTETGKPAVLAASTPRPGTRSGFAGSGGRLTRAIEPRPGSVNPQPVGKDQARTPGPATG